MTNTEIIKTLDCPYYLDDNILFLNIACEKLMELLPDKFFQLSICDPPFSEDCNLHGGRSEINGWGSKIWDNKLHEWNKRPDKEYFQGLFRISKNQIIWGGNYFIEHLKNTSCFIIRDKGQRNFSLADAEMAWTNIKKPVRIFEFSRSENNKMDRFHPTQKPIALYLWLLDNYAKPNDLIFDSHVGSASILIACMQKGFKCIGTELDVDYFNDAVKRIKLERAKLDNKFYLPENDLFEVTQ